MRNRFSVGWVFVSYLMIAGGLVLAAVALGILNLAASWVGHGLYVVGAFIGGFFAGRTSPGRTIAEPGVAGVLVALTVIGLLLVVPGAREMCLAGTDGIMVTVLKMGFVTGLGGFVGGMLGERTSRRQPSPSPVRWCGVSALINLGVLCLLATVYAFLALRWTGEAPDPDLVVLFGGGAVGALASGFVTQAIAPRHLPWACGSGAVGVILLIMGANAALGTFSGSALSGGLVLGGIGAVIGRVGADLAWSVLGSRRVLAPASDTELPEARLK